MTLCYNKGCGKEFHDNSQDSCQHHPGAPIFHEGYKGCSKGFHNPEKPKLPEKQVEKPLDVDEVITQELPKLMKNKNPDLVLERPSHDEPKIKIKSIIAQSLKTALDRLKEKLKDDINKQDSANDSIQVGAPCKHNSCESKYLGENMSHGECNHHPGYPVFHEGYKFWSCCKKRTSDFNEFLKQGGCEVGTHVWMKPSEIAEKKSVCRYDWHQTSKSVTLSIFAKCCDPEKCTVEVNQTALKSVAAFNGGINVFELDLVLHGVIVPEESVVEYLGTKVEIKLRKRDQFSWPRLEFVASS